MNYKLIHDSIIARGKTLGKYLDDMERHHIIPRCMGGTDHDDNLVYLTPREHFIIHQLLVKINSGHVGLAKAAIIMSKKTKFNHRHCSKQYEWLRKRSNQANRAISESKKGKKRSPELVQKLKDSWKNNEERREKTRQMMVERFSNEEERIKLSNLMTGVKKSDSMKKKMSEVASNRSEEHRRKLSESLTGRKLSEDSKNKMKQAKKNAPNGVCPHCDKEGKMMGGFVSWHFDNCRSKNNVG